MERRAAFVIVSLSALYFISSFKLSALLHALPIKSASEAIEPQAHDLSTTPTSPSSNDRKLAELYAPVLYFHPAELFRPQSVDVLVNTARLIQARRNWLDLNILARVSFSDLLTYRDAHFNLDAWLGNQGASDFKNYSAHRAYYQAVLSPDAGGPPIVAYAHVVHDEQTPTISLQYWLFYYYNDWFNKHEGDWEMVQVILNSEEEPEWGIYSQHHGGTRRAWSDIHVEQETHPAVYVALGSHANFFWGGEAYPNEVSVGTVHVAIMDRTGEFGPVIPEIVLVPDPEEVVLAPAEWSGLEWLPFQGRWGEIGPQSDFSGPLGPGQKGEQWEQPVAWGLSQPLDVDVWYRNRLRVEVLGESQAQIVINTASGDRHPSSESWGHIALLHDDPNPEQPLVAEILVPPGSSYTVLASWPNADEASISHYRFDSLPPSSSKPALLIFEPNRPPYLTLEGKQQAIHPSSVEVEDVVWDAPDLPWVAGLLPASEVVRGLTISLLAGLIPSLFYVTVLYYCDRFEKEPKPLLAATFIWGSVPALIVAVAVRIFFRLPPDMLGPEAIEAVRAGLVAPFIEEAVKGAAVLFIAYRYRMEFDNTLDGIVYGATTGFGFAMTGNTISYLGAFLLRGFAGLSNTIFVEGFLYGLNHGFYTAIFGATLGYARLAKIKWQRWAFPILGLLLSITIHSVHNLAMRNAWGPNPISLLLTWSGGLVLLVVMVWSWKGEHRVLQEELIGEAPTELYQVVTGRGGRARAQWETFRRSGIKGLKRQRKLHKLCAELAQKKMQFKRRPEEPMLGEEAQRYREELQTLLKDEVNGT